MDSSSHSSDDGYLKDDLRIFCYEMHNYILARRFWDKFYPDVIPVTESSKFSEEVGKAVLVAWHINVQTLRAIIKADYPLYAGGSDNFKRYIKIRFADVLSKHHTTMTHQLVLLTAFLLELYAYCFEVGSDEHVPYFVEVWVEHFLSVFYDTFKSEYGWQKLRIGCLLISLKYDAEQAEKACGVLKTKIKIKYFTYEEFVFTDADYQVKVVSQFHFIDKGTKKLSLPPNAPIRTREETLSAIAFSKYEVQEEILKLYKSSIPIFAVIVSRKSETSEDYSKSVIEHIESLVFDNESPEKLSAISKTRRRKQK